ncbi:MAG TPA: hypothetical protein VM554_13050 [Acidisarcina sp.]|nr:hypothetical protein [Acidisarcina sp.]
MLKGKRLSRPDRNTACIECSRRGHLCPAQIFVDEEPLCLDCADGEPCSYDRVRRRVAVEDVDVFGRPISAPAPVISRTPADLAGSFEPEPMPAPSPEVVQQKRKELPAMKADRKPSGRIPEIVKDAILAESSAISHADLGRKFNISAVSVGTIRRAAGIQAATARPRTPAKRAAKVAPVAIKAPASGRSEAQLCDPIKLSQSEAQLCDACKLSQSEICEIFELPPQLVGMAPEKPGVAADPLPETVSIEMDEAMADFVWRALPLLQKARALRAACARDDPRRSAV